MDAGSSDEATVYLRDLERGDRSAVDRLLPLIYEDLRAIAGAMMRNNAADQTLQPTALVHEAYLRLVRSENQQWNSRKHFFDVAAMAMRQLLINEARRRGAEKRGGERKRVLLSDIAETGEGGLSEIDVLAFNELLERLEAIDPRQSRIVELRFFAGLKVTEIAEILGVSDRTVRLDWRMARAWLQRELSEQEDS